MHLLASSPSSDINANITDADRCSNNLAATAASSSFRLSSSSFRFSSSSARMTVGNVGRHVGSDGNGV